MTNLQSQVSCVTSGSICTLLACFSEAVCLNAFVPVVQAGFGEQQQGVWMTAVFYSSSYRKPALEKKWQQCLSPFYFRLWQQNRTLALLMLAGSRHSLGVSPPGSRVILPQPTKSHVLQTVLTVLPQELFLPPRLFEFALSVLLYFPNAALHV